MLHVKLAGVVLDGPGRERVAEAVGMDFGHAGFPTQPAKHLFEPVGLEGLRRGEPAVGSEGHEEWAWLGPPPVEIGGEGLAAAPCERHDAFLVALAVPDVQAAGREVAVGQ